jgi:GntR family transcriptional regulator
MDDTREKDQRQPFLKELGIGFALDTKSGVPFYRQIIQAVERTVSQGGLKPGDRLPTIRALSIALKVNPNTVAKAYTELEIRGLIQTQVGSGTYVTGKSNDPGEKDRIKKKIEDLCVDLIRKAKALGAGKQELIKILTYLDAE